MKLPEIAQDAAKEPKEPMLEKFFSAAAMKTSYPLSIAVSRRYGAKSSPGRVYRGFGGRRNEVAAAHRSASYFTGPSRICQYLVDRPTTTVHHSTKESIEPLKIPIKASVDVLILLE